MRITVGTSASLMNQLRLDATVFAADQASPARSANLSVAVVSFCSSQLSTAPRSDVVSCGCAEVPCAGTASGCSVMANGAGAGFADEAAFCSAWRHDAAEAATRQRTSVRMRVIKIARISPPVAALS